MSRVGTAVRSAVDQAVVDRVRAGRLRDRTWPYGLRAVVGVGVVLYVLAGLLALLAGPVRRTSELTVPNSLTSAVPTGAVWVLILLLTFCLALLATATLHGPWWLATLGLLSLLLLLGAWSSATVPNRGLTLSLVLAVVTVLTLGLLRILRRRRELAWWEFPLVLGLLGAVLVSCTYDFAYTDRLLGYRLLPLFLEQTTSLLTFLVLPAAFAAGAAVAEIAVALTTGLTRTAQRQTGGRWPYVVLAAVLVLRLVQEAVRLQRVDPVESGWVAIVPALALLLGFAALGWAVHRLSPTREVPVETLPEELGRIGIPVGAAVLALMLPVYVFLFGFQIASSLAPGSVVGAFDPSPWVDRLVDAVRTVLGVLLVLLALRQARRGRPGPALVLGGVGLMLLALAARLLTGYRWAIWLDPDALVTLVTLAVLVVLVWLAARRGLTRDRALGLAAVLALAAVLSLRSVVADPVAAVLGFSGVAFVLFGVSWDFLTSSEWANDDGTRVRRPVRVLLAVGYPLLTATIVASDALIRRSRTFSDVNAFAELGELVLGTALLAAAATVVLRAVRRDRDVA